MLGVGLGLVLGAVRLQPLFSVRNLSLLAIASSTALGWLLYPVATRVADWKPDQADLLERVETTVVSWTFVGLSLFAGTLIVMDRLHRARRDGKPETVRWQGETARDPRIDQVWCRSLLTVLAACSAVILFVFWATGYFPMCFSGDQSAKYFAGATARYIPLRPLYLAAVNVLPVCNLLVLCGAWEAYRTRRPARLLGYAALASVGSLIMLMTLKRGELLLPFQALLVAVLMARETSWRLLVVGGLAMVAVATMLDARSRVTDLNEALCQVYTAVVPVRLGLEEAPESVATRMRHEDKMLGVAGILANNLSVEIRETVRLVYEFERRKSRYLNGRTYATTLFAFFPSKWSAFKRDYQLGRLALRWWGLDPDKTSGPRVAGLGEAYINFGRFGILVFPLVCGLIVWYLDAWYRRLLMRTQGSARVLAMTGLYLLTAYVGFGFYLNGSPALQALLLRGAAVAIILCAALPWMMWMRRREAVHHVAR